MNDDFNSPVLIANLFEGVRIINSVKDGKETIPAEDIVLLKKIFETFVFEVLGLKEETSQDQQDLTNGLMKLILELRENARIKKDFAASDQIRNALQNLNIVVKDTKDGPVWNIE